MANFKDSPHFEVEDQYYTPIENWAKIIHLIPKNVLIWESCMLNATKSKSIENLTSLGLNVIGNTKWDMLEYEPENYDMIITNIPFETKIKQKILKRLMEIGKPFIIIMNSCNIHSNYFNEIMDLDNTQIITPRGKLHYVKHGEEMKKNTSFYSVFVAYKMNLKNKDLFV